MINPVLFGKAQLVVNKSVFQTHLRKTGFEHIAQARIDEIEAAANTPQVQALAEQLPDSFRLSYEVHPYRYGWGAAVSGSGEAVDLEIASEKAPPPILDPNDFRGFFITSTLPQAKGLLGRLFQSDQVSLSANPTKLWVRALEKAFEHYQKYGETTGK